MTLGNMRVCREEWRNQDVKRNAMGKETGNNGIQNERDAKEREEGTKKEEKGRKEKGRKEEEKVRKEEKEQLRCFTLSFAIIPKMPYLLKEMMWEKKCKEYEKMDLRSGRHKQ
mmetsp:Transcript_30599/g.55748  ORF Transcript_30599/g.55748 Transcript_30599/m.55748 type:complete len:113 (-) Transcript_30599:149-487(-)